MSRPSPQRSAAGRLPDFIIGGAMKSGTTSLHYLLESHDQVFIPNKEIHFFCLDDIVQHPDFFGNAAMGFVPHDYEWDYATYLDWYRKFFASAPSTGLIGEHSTLYLTASEAPRRMARLLPQVKLIFALRDPVARVYSHYWHQVRSGVAIHSFEQTLELDPGKFLLRGCYRQQLERYRRHFPASQLNIVLFEELRRHPQAVIDQLCDFLRLENTIDLTAIKPHQHPTQVPRFPRLQLRLNRLFRTVVGREYVNHLPNALPASSPAAFNLLQLTDRFLRRVHLSLRPYPPMALGTRRYLEEFYRRKNAGLGGLLGLNLKKYWTYMDD